MTSQQQLVCDNSTLANFKQWAQAISNFLASIGWTKTADTGQVNWSTISSVPGSAAFVYEIWQPGDGLAVFYAKVQYGNFSGTNSPCVAVQLGSGTNGSGTLIGFISEPYTTAAAGITPPSTTTQYECNFSGDAGRICCMLWRNAGSNVPQFFGIERSLNSSGAPTSTHVTVAVMGAVSGNTGAAAQQSLVLGVGAAQPSPAQSLRTGGGAAGGFIVRCAYLNNANSTQVSGAFHNSISFDTISPMVGFYDYPLTMCGSMMQADMAEGVTFTTTLYGSVRTYMPSKAGPFGSAAPGNLRYDFQPNMGLCMRFD